MDDLDRAKELTDARIADAIAAARRALADGPAAETCEWCGDEIPEARRRVVPGCRLCVMCQTIKEDHGYD